MKSCLCVLTVNGVITRDAMHSNTYSELNKALCGQRFMGKNQQPISKSSSDRKLIRTRSIIAC